MPADFLDGTFGTFQRRLCTFWGLKIRKRECSVQPQNVTCDPFFHLRGWPNLWWLPEAVEDNKETFSGLWNAEVDSVQHLLPIVVAELLHLVEPFFITAPRAHMYHVFHDDPARFESTSKSRHSEGGHPTLLGPAPIPPRAGVACAFGRCKHQPNASPDSLAHLTETYGLSVFKKETDLRKVVKERIAGKVPVVDRRHDLDTGRLRAPAAPTRSREKVKCSDHSRHWLTCCLSRPWWPAGSRQEFELVRTAGGAYRTTRRLA